MTVLGDSEVVVVLVLDQIVVVEDLSDHGGGDVRDEKRLRRVCDSFTVHL